MYKGIVNFFTAICNLQIVRISKIHSTVLAVRVPEAACIVIYILHFIYLQIFTAKFKKSCDSSEPILNSS